MSDPTANASRDLLEKSYRQLTLLEQEIVQLFSIIYEPVSRTDFLGCFNALQQQINPAHKLFTTPTLKPFLEKLLTLKLLIQESGQGLRCNPLFAEIATRNAIRANNFETLVQVVEKKLPINMAWSNTVRRFKSNQQLVREVRIGIYRQDLKFIKKQFEDYYRLSSQTITLNDVLKEVVNNPFDAEWFSTLCPELFELALIEILSDSALSWSPAEEVFIFLKDQITIKSLESDRLRALLVEELLLRGNLTLAESVVSQISETHQISRDILQGWLAFLKGENPSAIAHYRKALTLIKKTASKRKVYFNSLGGIFFIFALLKEGSGLSFLEALGYAEIGRDSQHWLSPLYRIFVLLIQWQQGNPAQQEQLLNNCFYDPNDEGLLAFFKLLCLHWADTERHDLVTSQPLQVYRQAKAAGYEWFAMEAAEILGQAQPQTHYSEAARFWREEQGTISIVDTIKPLSAWELSLTALTQLTLKPEAGTKAGARESSKRLAWFISFYSNQNYEIQPREQIINSKGAWSQGRAIALKRLAKSGEFDYLTPQDLQVCTHLESHYSYGYYGKSEYSFGQKAIAALIGHPLVFWEKTPTVRIEIVKGEPELLVKKSNPGKLILKLSPEFKESDEIVVIKESPTRLKVIEVKKEHRLIATILGSKNRLEVPIAAQEKVLTAINAVSSLVTIHSDIGGGLENVQEVPAQAQPHIHLLPAGEGLKVAVLTRPFAEGGPYYQPGKGGETVITEINGQRFQTTRSLKEEKNLAQQVIQACPTLERVEPENGEWLIEDPEQCLELLIEIGDLGETAIIEWPEGEKLRVSHQAGFSQLRLTIEKQRDWFAADGELRLDDNQVLGLQQLLDLLDQSKGRFVQLAEGQFLALTKEFRQRLEELRSFSEKQGKGRRFHPLAALALEEVFDEATALKADKHWKAHIKRLKEMETLDPQLPSTLQAELRDYQLEGFQWLARLAHWGVGACLADDMGLGKTIQALALILTRASQGPTLIVAPTSVCPNWSSEAVRFAPTLNPISFGTGDRQKVLDHLQPFDLVLCTYGLLQQEEVAEMLAKVQWQTVVLDEAQAIKNFATKRSQAAMNLQGGFKLLTTGTPIENHLGELWNLFRFINPGFLGSLESFNVRFAVPIEKYQDKNARNQLKKLIQPFLLRRTKNQVLSELPSRTEILLQVELSQEEMAFYEALRRQAIAKLEATDTPAGAKHLQVLAEIMRLRRACCNPRLVLPETPLPSAKLELFGEILKELLDNGHKTLVFSQFVDHLHIIRDYLDQKKITYQYLDGSTPGGDRKKRVDAFQAGNGDVFLISLKAGGTGLNLTAADYVIHMDPWWNPAVEDQASDRAHRIGQQRPVTIYRLVAKNTIEEKIVDLHRQKRDLADSLLEGTEMSGKISTEQLLQLMSS